MAEQHNLFRKHPKTIFIDAHLGWLGNDLGRLGKLLDEMPNVYTEIGAVLHELGRQPRAARELFIKYQDRVLFGKDIWEPSEYHVYFRVLETRGRVLRLLPQAPRLLEDVRPRPARRGAEEALLQERAADHPGIDKSAFPS